MASSSKRPKAVFPTSKLRKIADFIQRVLTILSNIGGNTALFANPNPTIALVTANLGTLQTAQTLAQTRAAGSAGARNVKFIVVLKNIFGLLSYVQDLADNAADEATAIAIINASGFDLKTYGTRVKPPLAAKNGTVSGSVKLTAKSAGNRVSYDWAQSADTINWTDLPSTLQAKTTVTGLTPVTKMYFRFRVITAAGTGDWSQPIWIIVQ